MFVLVFEQVGAEVNSTKTVEPAKAKKQKTTITYNFKDFAFGNAVAYAKKSSGSSKVSVKSGKAHLAKGVKKGTYKATVKDTAAPKPPRSR